MLKEIELYLDGELEPSASSQLDRHLAECTPCADRSDFKRRLKELISSRCGCAVPPDLMEGVRARLGDAPQA
ncbi:MAG: zf-HC2 domain-containing protein [Actinomycetota bacterium]|nr:zf-HC2 domain-containing protein [Actinomycetota bacterium]